jgi:septal ring factor EnvC (AmiA/AmiB activator)
VTKIKRVEVQIESEQLKSSYLSCQKDRDSLQTQLASVKLELEDYHNKLTESVANNKMLQEQVQYKNIDSLQTQLASVKLELEDYHNRLTESQTNNKLLQE